MGESVEHNVGKKVWSTQCVGKRRTWNNTEALEGGSTSGAEWAGAGACGCGCNGKEAAEEWAESSTSSSGPSRAESMSMSYGQEVWRLV